MQLVEARGKLDKAVTLLEQFRAGSRAKHGDQDENPAPRRESINRINDEAPGGEDHHVRASHSSAKKSAAKTAAGGSASRPVSLGQEKSSKRGSGARLFMRNLKPLNLLYVLNPTMFHISFVYMELLCNNTMKILAPALLLLCSIKRLL
jgi:hypothetical protein